MQIFVQWARAGASDWEAIEASEWYGLPNRPEPATGARVDGDRGWVNAVNVQGVILQGDWYAIERLPGDGVRAYQVNDGPMWSGRRNATVVDIHRLAPDPSLNGAINTRTTQRVYGESGYLKVARPRARTTYLPWASFAPPPESLRRYGVTMPDELYQRHRAAQSRHGWREWCGHLSTDELRHGRLRSQRARGRYIRPKGTRTYFHNAVAQAIGAVNANNENSLGAAAAGAVTQGSGNFNNPDLLWATASPSGEPDSAAWPTGTYRAQLDVTTANPDAEFGLLTIGSAAGGFCRWSSTLATQLEINAQAQLAFSLPGLHLATYTGSWTAGADTDRFGFVVAGERVAGHGSLSIDMQLGETDDFTDGPWPAAPGALNDAIFFGVNA